MVHNYQLFRTLPDMEIMNKLLETFGLESITDTKYFTKVISQRKVQGYCLKHERNVSKEWINNTNICFLPSLFHSSMKLSNLSTIGECDAKRER